MIDKLRPPWLVVFILSLGLLADAGPTSCPAAEPRVWPVEITSGRFEIHSDFKLLDQQGLSRELERLSHDLTTLLKLPLSDQSIHIVVFESVSEYERYMRNYFPNLPRRRALYIQDRGPGMLFTHWHADVAMDLRHEVVHALLNADVGTLPLWLDEGLAEYFEVEAAERFRDNGYLPAAARLAREQAVPALDLLESITSLDAFHDENYRDSWSWIHFLLHRSQETRQLLIRFLQDSRGGKPSPALSRSLRAIYPDLEQQYRDHFLRLERGP